MATRGALTFVGGAMHPDALEPRFDHVRDAILGGSRNGFIAMLHQGDPEHSEVTLMYNLIDEPDGESRMSVAAKYYGVTLLTDSRLPEPLAEPTPMSLLPFTIEDFPFSR